MKKLLSMLILGISLLAEPFSSSFNGMKEDLLVAHAAEVNSENKSREVDLKYFNLDWYADFDDIPKFTPDYYLPGGITMDVEEGSYLETNSLYNKGFIVSSKKEDVLSTIMLNKSENISSDRFIVNEDTGHTYFTINASNFSYNVGFQYITFEPIIYFNNKLEKKNISFYLYCDFDLFYYLQWLLDLNPSLIGSEITLLTINNYEFLKVKLVNDNGHIFYPQLSFYTENYASIEPAYTDKLWGNEKAMLYKITIPYMESITNITYLDAFKDDEDYISKKENVVFAFDESMSGYYYYYFFDFCSLSVINHKIGIEGKYVYFDEENYTKYTFTLKSMKVLFTGTKKVTNLTTKDAISITPSTTIGKVSYIPLDAKVYDCTFTLRDSEPDENGIVNWLYDGLDFENNVSGSIKIQSLTFEINENGKTLTHHYDNCNIHKYSFNCDKGIRTYYYTMKGYYRNEFRSWHLATIFGGWMTNAEYNFQVFGFDFYFDKQKTMEIPNVQSITLKYQFGYSGPNPKEGTNGFYPNDPDEPYKDIRIRTIAVKEHTSGLGKYDFGINDLDKDDENMGLVYDAHDYMMTDDDGYTHDYIIYKWRKRGTDYYSISTMDALEITYQSEAQETVRMVGNSLGLHVVTDDDGNMIVCDADGNPRTEYGVYVSEDGSAIPGLDTNGDGKVTIDETINSDTGEKSYPMYTGNTEKPKSILDYINDLKEQLTSGTDIIMKVVKITIVVVTIVVILWLLKKIIRFFKRL